MTVPTAYSESALAEYLFGQLDQLGSVLGWTAGDPPIVEAVNDALLDYGASDISTITAAKDLRRLRALGRRALWRGVVQATAGKYDFSDSDAKFSRSQMQDMARKALELAETDCLEFSPTYMVGVVHVTRTQDPYVVIPDTERLP